MKWLYTLVAAATLTLTVWAQPLLVDGHHGIRTIAGDGKDIVIEGHHLEVLVSGHSGRITISGHHNQVVLENPTAIDASGHDNQIVYRAGQPVLTEAGRNNEIVRGDGVNVVGTPATGNSSEMVEISGAGEERVEDGRGRNFAVSGAGNKITIRGQAGRVDVTGSGNVITIEQCNAITVSGIGNTVSYSKGQPSLDESGLNNKIIRH